VNGSKRRPQLRRNVLHRERAMRSALLSDDLVVYELFVDLRLIHPISLAAFCNLSSAYSKEVLVDALSLMVSIS